MTVYNLAKFNYAINQWDFSITHLPSFVPCLALLVNHKMPFSSQTVMSMSSSHFTPRRTRHRQDFAASSIWVHLYRYRDQRGNGDSKGWFWSPRRALSLGGAAARREVISINGAFPVCLFSWCWIFQGGFWVHLHKLWGFSWHWGHREKTDLGKLHGRQSPQPSWGSWSTAFRKITCSFLKKKILLSMIDLQCCTISAVHQSDPLIYSFPFLHYFPLCSIPSDWI